MSIGNDTFKSMSVDFADVNNDGIFDWYVSNIASPFAMQENHFLWVSTGKMDKIKKGIAPWVDKAEDLGVGHSAWAWDARFEDFDNCGTVELVQGHWSGKRNGEPLAGSRSGGRSQRQLVRHPASWPRFLPGSDVDGSAQKPFWVRGDDGHYVNLANDLWPDMTSPARGIAVADVYGNGYPDMVFANFWDNSVFIKNNGSGNRFMELYLLLPAAEATDQPAAIQVHDGHPTWREGTPAVGAFVEIETPDGRKADQTIRRRQRPLRSAQPRSKVRSRPDSGVGHPGADYLARFSRDPAPRCADAWRPDLTQYCLATKGKNQ